ncbi:MAG: TrkH family potassium uptake protein, partial [Synergistaceae bacterium]|nr:TrkH family potassium uptake protein [Synergistaceae bacterium]
MKIWIVLKVLSLITGVITLFMFFPLVLAFYDNGSDLNAFLFSILCSAAIGLILWFIGRTSGIKGRRDYKTIGIREGVGVVVFSWIIASGVGALPYYFSGVTSLYTDAFFETMSGFTTTGATILTDIEAAPRGILLWRALTHLMGGMGIIVFSLAVMPFLGIGGMELFKAEVPGVTAEKLTPRLHDTAALLWKIYFLLVFAETLFLIFGGMNLFDAFTHSCSTIATGGFSTKNNSIAYFNSAYIEWIIILFMFAAGINFSLYFLLIAGGRRTNLKIKLKNFIADEELRWYFKIVLLASIAITLSLILTGKFTGVIDTFRHAAFHVVSVITTTGFI